MDTMTEDEAKERWCPFARVSEATERDSDSVLDCGVVNRDREDGGPAVGAFCLASQCMAWRWGELEAISRVRIGYCGLAGKP